MSEEIDVTKLDDDVRGALLAILDQIEREDEYLRLQQLRQFKKNNLFWHGFQYLFWSDVDQDWRIPTHQEFEEISAREENKWIFDYVINIFKAHGESIIAALSADIPDVRFGPRNAEDPEDYRAVKAADNASELIEKWNRAKLLIINSLFYLANEGFVASYTYHHKDKEYGETKIPVYDKRMEQTLPDSSVCPNCGYGEQSQQPPQAQCPQCGSPMVQQPGQEEEVVFQSGTRLVPCGREVIEVYGPLNCRVPSYVTKQADSGYLIHYVDADPALFKDLFPSVADKIEVDSGQNYERVMRQSSLSMEGFQQNVRLATLKRCWFRLWMLNRLESAYDDDCKNRIRSMFPDGIYFAVNGETICQARSESQDRHWTLTKAGPSKGVHADPLLQSLVPIQEIRNNLMNLFVMQVEYGVPATYADSEVFDFEGQSKQEVSPGYIYPVVPRPGQTIDSAFYSERIAMLSKESTDLLEDLDSSGQFVTGSYPSVFGGPAQSGSKTLGEYEKSRSFALQRLSMVWYFLNVWWGETLHKAVLSFIDHQIEDQTMTTQTSPGAFMTKWIKKADFKGSFDRLDPEASSDFPTSFAQKRSVLMNLLTLGNPEINSVILSPDNASLVQAYVGLPDLKIPTEIQKNKQIREILMLTGMEPQQTAEGMQSTVPIEPDIDDHEVHIQVLTDFLADIGQDLKETNPQGYGNCMAHLLEHKKFVMMQQMQLGAQPNVGPPNPANAARV